MRVLSLHQPWATLAVAPALQGPGLGGPLKRWETRHWAPRIALPFTVAIHATKTVNGDVLAFLSPDLFASALRRSGYYPGDPRPFEKRGLPAPSGLRLLPFGAIIGVAEVVEVITTTEFTIRAREGRIHADGQRLAEEYTFGHYGPERFAWRLELARALPTPIPFTGRQEPLYEVPEHALEQIERQLGAVEVQR